MFCHLYQFNLDGNQRYRLTEKMNDVEKPSIKTFRYQNREVLPLWKFPFLIIPIFNRMYYVFFVRFSKHNFDFKHFPLILIFQQNIKTAIFPLDFLSGD